MDSGGVDLNFSGGSENFINRKQSFTNNRNNFEDINRKIEKEKTLEQMKILYLHKKHQEIFLKQ
jgi:hypothetical protein